ncbi:hypothetical protein DERP_010545 [Dermatophagoides pteronyssinus]|uniref:Uncharacterized protein n=1 Tax=Dermatophagoides pteronyssinus TaxID=6956 RepID=A0ABQ8JFP0_DERPT|nr:hypothetical protein DERP_010545 [Dermatophagoides pteronyssinus]
MLQMVKTWCLIRQMACRPPSGTKHCWPCFNFVLQILSPCCLAQHKPSLQSSESLHLEPRCPCSNDTITLAIHLNDDDGNDQ